MVSRNVLLALAFITTSLAQIPSGLRTPTPPPVESKQEITPELRGDIMVARKMYREAIDFYKPGAEKNPVMANKTGIAYHQLSELASAKKFYERAARIKPDYAEAINNLGTVFYAQKNYRRAIASYKKALDLDPRSASVLSNLGTAYFARKNYDLALVTYQEALKMDPEVFEHRGTMGSTLVERSVEERAKFHFYLAKVYAKDGSYDRALLYLRKALEEGFKDKDKILSGPEFAALKDNEEFKQIMAMEQKVL